MIIPHRSTDLTHWAYDEIIRPTQTPVPEENVLRCYCPIPLLNRNIYVYIEGKFTGASASYILAGEVELRNHGSKRGRFPVQIGTISALSTKRSLVSMVNGGGSAAGNSAAIKLASPFGVTAPDVQTTDAVLQPYQIVAEINEVVFHLTSAEALTSTMPGWRALMIVQSLGNQ